MTAPRGPQRSEDRSDLTPDEARAEVEAFMGPGWECLAGPYDPYDGAMPRPHVRAYFGDCIELAATEATYRAAVDALKQAWRDAVRPWMEAAIEAKLDTADVDGYAPDERVIARVLGEDSNG